MPPNLGPRTGPRLGPNLGPNVAFGQPFLDTQAEWEALLGITLHWGFQAGGGIPYADYVGSNDLDTSTGTGGDDDAPWPFSGGGACYESTGETNRVESTNTDFLLPGTGNWTMFGLITRGVLTDDNNAGVWDASNGNGAGLRLVNEFGNVDDRLTFTAENQAAAQRLVQISPGGRYSANQALYFTFSRVSTVRLDAWISAAGSIESLHENLTITASDNFNSSGSVFGIGRNNVLGNANPGTRVKGLLWSRGQVGSLALHDLFRGNTTQVVTEA